MKGTIIKTIFQSTVVLFAGILLLGCPIDPTKDLFTGDVTVVNNTNNAFDHVSIETSGIGSNLGGLANGGASVTHTGYDCSTNYTNTIRPQGGSYNTSFYFIPPCGGTETITWSPG